MCCGFVDIRYIKLCSTCNFKVFFICTDTDKQIYNNTNKEYATIFHIHQSRYHPTAIKAGNIMKTSRHLPAISRLDHMKK